MTATVQSDLLSELRDSARRFLGRATSGEIGDPSQFPPTWWSTVASLGWLGLVAPERAGGVDAGAPAAAVVLEELAYHDVTAPFMSSAFLATRALSAPDASSLADRWLPAMVEGRATAAVAVTDANGLIHRQGIGPRLVDDADGTVTVIGPSHYVVDAGSADLLLVAATDSAGVLSVVGIERHQPGVTVVPLRVHDRSHRLGHVQLGGVTCARESVLARGPVAESIFAALFRDGLFALGADALGAARRAFDLSLEYAKLRHQFGRPIGSFQAIKHKLADMYVLLTGSTALLNHAASALEAGDDNDRGLVAAGSYVREAAARVTGDALQIHGAHGYVWEHPCHWLLKRAKFDERYLSTLWAERDRLASLTLAPLGEGK